MHLTDTRLRVRSVFISDLHLGTRGSQADMLLDFLQRTECETLYLVGDIFDGWRLRKSWYWHENFDAIVRHILQCWSAMVRIPLLVTVAMAEATGEGRREGD